MLPSLSRFGVFPRSSAMASAAIVSGLARCPFAFGEPSNAGHNTLDASLAHYSVCL